MRCLLTLFLFACSDYAIKNEIKSGPRLVVYPETIDFGHLTVGEETGQDSFAVINAGDEDLIIESPVLSNENKFLIDNNLQEEYVILPGESVEFGLYYSPTTYEENITEVIITSNDENKEYYELPVIGIGDAPLISVEPFNLNFGNISVGCVVLETLTISNNGNLNLIISDITQLVTPPVDITLDYGTLPSFPWVLVPQEEIDFTVQYDPSDVSSDESQLTITSNDPANTSVSVRQEGYGDVVHWFNERHTQDEHKIVDILFVVDNSGSMNSQQNELAFQMNSFMNILENMNVDYHLGFITTDTAILKSFGGYDWIDSNHPEPSIWASNVISAIGIAGSPNEQGIYFAHIFTSLMSTSSSRYWRPNASYVIVYISDEPDFSPNGYSTYFGFFDNVKQSPSLVRQFAVIGDYPGGCLFVNSVNGNSYNIPYGAGYYEMTQRYNGASYSICAADWGLQMQNLATEVSIKSSFELQETDVIEESIEVKVNGQVVNEWIYDTTSNSIIFDYDHVPESGNVIDIDYAILGCD